MNQRDWASVISENDVMDFVNNRLKLNCKKVEKHHNDNYGTYFVVVTKEKVYDPVLYFGKYGKLKIEETSQGVRFIEDFEFSKNNQIFMQEYVSFVYAKNKIDGKNRKIYGKTYISDFNDKLKKYEAIEEESKIEE